ncbi:hypothetical protein M6B38_381000 [Iris pallida]|uniref:Uncharacterized protein n=1 Tax=Iris pallida TaxID=29817 RepID=A0AAX6G9B0_IRIPA|nr:hypothetical protein M6B38_181890 [Iris pallida]KAJ6824957.1 hypothetical protein M6B38_381000 [Iris pallida]
MQCVFDEVVVCRNSSELECSGEFSLLFRILI